MNLKLHAYSALMVLGQSGVGLGVIVATGFFQPSLSKVTLSFLGALALIMAGTALLFQQSHKNYPAIILTYRHLLGCLLLGSSLAAALWRILGLGHTGWLIVTGMIVRWYLFGSETIHLHHEDRMKHPRPSSATQARRMITIVTGALIPLLLLAGVPPIPWLSISFLLTAFCQWTIARERCHEFDRSGIAST